MFYFFNSAYFEISSSEFGFVDKNVRTDQLPVVFIRGHHIRIEPFFFSQLGQCAYDIIGFETGNFYDRYIVGFDNFFYNRYGLSYYLRSFFSLCFIKLICFVPESRTTGIESYCNMGRIFFFQYVFQRIYKSEYSGGIYSFRVDSRIFDECVI